MGPGIRHNGVHGESPAPTIDRTITSELPAQLVTCKQNNNYELGTATIEGTLQEMDI
jgi:hypothetical protein